MMQKESITMIRIEQLEKSFGKLRVLNGVNAAFDGGQVVAVVGPNASGKTTLIKCILGMVIPEAGHVLVENQPIEGSFTYKKQIGYMPQIGRYPDNMQIGQLFRMMKDIRSDYTREYDEDLIRQFSLEAIFQKPMRTMSGGTRQKVSAALAFLFDPAVLILDEPTAGLDPLAAEILKSKIQRSRDNGKLVIITSHIMNEVDELAGCILYLMEGSVKFHLATDNIKARTRENRLGKAIAQLLNPAGHA